MSEIRTLQHPRRGESGGTLAKKFGALVLGAAGLTMALLLTTMGPASAAVVTGQFVDKTDFHCGGQERITGSADILGVTFPQHAWIYYNCSDQTLFRKADIIKDWDGDCHGIGPGQARVLATKHSPFEDVFRGSKPC